MIPLKFNLQFLLITLTMLIVSTIVNAQSKISFDVSFTEPQAHYVDVEMLISGNKEDKLEIKMPVWTPGSYFIREFAKNVESLKASGNKEDELKVVKIDKNTWSINCKNNNKIKINYRVYAFEISVRTSFVDQSHAFLSPTGIFMYVKGQLSNSAIITIKPAKGWKHISTGLDKLNEVSNIFYASNFDELFDSPIEIGNQEIFEFLAAGVKHEVAMYGGGNYNKERLKTDMSKIVNEETAIFKTNPNKRYVFIVHNYNSGGGGLEHSNSTVLGATRFGYINEDTYTNFLSLVAHEYFHLWNVKRLRPIALGPFNYDSENYTTNLWIAEGFTAYYDNLILRRTNFHSPERYLDIIADEINLVENQPGNRIQAVSESSFDAWIKQYRPNENSKNSGISYYNKGALIALVMDLEIINATRGKKCLDDLMSTMYDEFYTVKGRGYTDLEFRTRAEKIVGKSFDQIYDDYVNGTKMINYSKILGYAGLELKVVSLEKTFFGVTTIAKEGKDLISNIARGSSAWIGGLNVNDELISIDDCRFTDTEKMLREKKIGDKIQVLVNRDGNLIQVEIKLIKDPSLRYQLMSVKSPTASQLVVRGKWLNF
ncbi:MAG: M61 family metallopeptidase [Flavobacterium sp.]|nr:M61 family metallopeptidase [Pedobacter sp.]